MTHLRSLIINLEKDQDRYLNISEKLTKIGMHHQRIPGFNGPQAPHFLLKRMRLGQNPASLRPGTFGCFMSHIKAWEIISEGTYQHNLIMEDDINPSPRLENFNTEYLPDGYDIVFVNDRLCGHLPANKDNFTLFPFSDAIKIRPNGISNPGGDGYIMSIKGSQKLLKIIEDSGIGRHVDIYICLKSLNTISFQNVKAFEKIIEKFKDLGRPLAPGEELESYCISPPLVRIRSGIKSSRVSLDAGEDVQ